MFREHLSCGSSRSSEKKKKNKEAGNVVMMGGKIYCSESFPDCARSSFLVNID
jgi:hypothetical protein